LQRLTPFLFEFSKFLIGANGRARRCDSPTRSATARLPQEAEGGSGRLIDGGSENQFSMSRII
jgi:hypothetical protein